MSRRPVVVFVALLAIAAGIKAHAQTEPRFAPAAPAKSVTTVPVKPVPTEHKILPPPEYDYVYEGDLTIVMVKTIEELRILCNVNNPGTLACSIRAYDTKSCVIIMVEDEVMRRHGWTTGLLLRHEMGHCNGWTQAHEGQRSVYSGDSYWVPETQRIRLPADRWRRQLAKQWDNLCPVSKDDSRLTTTIPRQNYLRQ